MNKGEFLSYLSDKYEVPIIVDLPEPKEGDLEGRFNVSVVLIPVYTYAKEQDYAQRFTK